MNIFVSDLNPHVAARNLDNKRVVKMILETTQLLSSAVILNGGNEAPYKLTHKNHPCTKWTANNQSNFKWLIEHGISLCKEYTLRYNKIHKCNVIILEMTNYLKYLPEGNLTPFPNCTTNKEHNISYQHVENTVDAYRFYLNARWKNDKLTPKWTNNTKPEWTNYEPS